MGKGLEILPTMVLNFNLLDLEVSYQGLLQVAAILVIGYLVLTAIYELYFSPLSKIPGPWYAAVSRLWLIYRSLRGGVIFTAYDLHKQYGPYVRMSPNEISVAEIESVRKIHAPSDPYEKAGFYKTIGKGFKTIFVLTDHEEYKHRLKALGGGFAAMNLALLEPVIRKHVNTCVSKLKQELDNGRNPDVFLWVQFMSTDIIGEISFGKDFGMLESETINPLIRDAMTYLALLAMRAFVPLMQLLEPLLSHIPHSGIQRIFGSEQRILKYSNNAILSLVRDSQDCKDEEVRPNLFSKMLRNLDNPKCRYKMTMEEIRHDSFGFILGGSDTVTITGSFIIWAILRHIEVRKKLEAEFQSLGVGDITDKKLQTLPFLKCVIQEGVRMYSAAQFYLPRAVPGTGRKLGPYFLPGGVEVITPIYTIQRNSDIFPEPHVFKPERWMNATDEMNDAIIAFGGSSRGKNLSMMEMRLLIAVLLTEYPEVDLAESCTDESMEIVEFLCIKPRGGKCELKKKKIIE
ncbi:hypothetical protein TWF594_003947 [Orbilia oligospora]|nr:hypothetical protein TWF594_003947 [Orbilia oligospora]